MEIHSSSRPLTMPSWPSIDGQKLRQVVQVVQGRQICGKLVREKRDGLLDGLLGVAGIIMNITMKWIIPERFL